MLSCPAMAKDVLTAVRGAPELSLDVSELLRRPGSTRTLVFARAVDGLALPLARVKDGSELAFDLRLESLVDGIHVRGTVAGELDEQCRRCLRAFDAPIAVDLDGLFEGGGEGDSYPIVSGGIDLEAAVRDAVVLALPLHPLCREDCAGLCPTCGADRNTGDCGHHDEHEDVRWEALARLRERLEE